MADKDRIASVENSLVQRYNERGYLLEDEVIDCCVDHDLDLAQIDAVCDRLLKRNIIFRDSASNSISEVEDDDDVYDRSHIDYDEFLNRVEREYPSCRYLVNQIKAILPPQHKEWRTLIGEAKNGNSFAFERLILMYLRTILKRAYDFSISYHCDFEDSFQNGVIGFINAINKYDITSPDSFVSYFQLWLVQSMSRECSIDGTIMRYPIHYKDRLMAAINRISEEYYNPDEIVRMEQRLVDDGIVDIDGTGVHPMLDKAFMDFYGEEYLELAGEQFDYNHLVPYRQLFDEIESDESIEERFVELDNDRHLREIMDLCLRDREKDVIILRYGFDDGRAKTLEEVGAIFGVTRERVRQIECKALRKMRIHCEKVFK